jgi:FKBP-type peptidyl-prolyl cis-trans isomerase
LQEIMMGLQKDVQAKAAERGEKAKKEGEDFLAANKSKEGVKTLPSGLQYKVMKEGKGPKPKPTDVVSTHYRGTLIDGTEFDSSYKRGEPTEFPVGQVIPGWTEALTNMNVGSKWQVFIPSGLAYGPGGQGPIPPNSTLVFEMELLAIKDPNAPSAPAATPK